MVKALWVKLTLAQRYLFSGILFVWLAAGICDTRGAAALAATATAVLLIWAGAIAGANAEERRRR
jgi:hypothetical protein